MTAEVFGTVKGGSTKSGRFYAACQDCGYIGLDRSWTRLTNLEPDEMSTDEALSLCKQDADQHNVAHHGAILATQEDTNAPSYLTDLIQGNIFHPDEAETLIRMIRERTAYPPTVEVHVTVNHDETEVRLQYVSEEPPPVKFQAAFLAARIMNFESHALHLETSDDGRTVTARLEGTR